MSLQKIMEEIKKVRVYADEEVGEHPRETLGGRLARQKKAKEDMKSLTESYRQALLNSAVFILVVGDKREEFVKIGTEEFKFFTADPDQFYKDIAGQVSPSLYENKTSSPNVLDVVSRVLENKAMDVGILGYPMISFKQEHSRFIVGRAEFTQLIKEIISKQVGTEVVGAMATKAILSQALEMEHDGKTTPILLPVSEKNVESLTELISGLRRISRNVAIVTTSSGDLDPLSVASSLESIKNQMKSGYSDIPSVEVKQVAKLKEEVQAIESLAKTEGLTEESIADVIKQNQANFGVDEATDLAVAETIVLSEVDAQKFVDTLVDPPAPTEALIKAVSKRNKNKNK